ncbi:hypothetical protein ACP70R_030992 [Stipagrostis hirtigluma subsp. patula]
MEEEVQEGEEEAGVRKRKRGGGGEVVVGGGGGGYEKDLLGVDGEEEEEEGCYEGIAEEAVEEVMRWLEMEISPAPPDSEDAALGFVTINGNEESCGPSFSAAASTVMASVDTRAGAPPPPPVPWPWPWPVPDSAAPALETQEVPPAEAGEADEEWLVKLLTCGPVLEGGLAL